MKEEIEWTDGLLPRSRMPYLLLATLAEGGIVRFKGKSIPGVAASRVLSSTRNGRWSSTTYALRIAEGVGSVVLTPDFETDQIFSGAGSWEDAYALFVTALRKNTECTEAAGPGIKPFTETVRAEFPHTARRLDRIEAETAGLAKTPVALAAAFARAAGTQRSGT